MQTINRMHIAINVESIEESKQFYSQLLGHEPTQIADDQIDWVIDNPATHFSIFHSDTLPKGLEHIGIDYTETDLLKAKARLQTEAAAVIDPNGVKVELYSKPRQMKNPYKSGIVMNLR
ncbi:MAG: hypothetical protein KDD94_04820 [Calditrichaeota bacterium]|nr:hypothetical protein [Calditrichota bacterium]